MDDVELNTAQIMWAVATVNLPGLPLGTAALVNPDKPAIRGRIAAGYLRICTYYESSELDKQAGRRGSNEHSPGV